MKIVLKNIKNTKGLSQEKWKYLKEFNVFNHGKKKKSYLIKTTQHCMLTDVFQTYCWAIIIHRIFYGFSRFDKEHTADMTGQQGMLYALGHLILPLIFVEVRVSSGPVLFFLWNFDFEYCLL